MPSRSSRRYAGGDPASIRVTPRDSRVLECIHAFDGMMSFRQLDQLFFSGQGSTWTAERLRALTAHDFLRTTPRSHQHLVPVGERIYWLGRKGAQHVAGLRGESLRGFSWRRAPRWSIVQYDLRINDFRIAVLTSLAGDTALNLMHWTPERAFLSHPDTVHYRHQRKRLKRQVRPDGMFVLRRTSDHKPADYAFLLEIDMATEDNPRFVRDKVLPGLAYLKSDAYQKRFGLRYGRWLVATTTEQRLNNMIEQTSRAGGAGQFYFTTWSQISSETVLHAPIWRVAGTGKPISLLPSCA